MKKYINHKKVSLELSMRIRELGDDQQSDFYYYSEKNIKNEQGKWERCSWVLIKRNEHDISSFAGEWGYKKYVAAYTTEDIIEKLLNKGIRLRLYKDESNSYWCNVRANEEARDGLMFAGTTLADAVADCYIGLLLNKII